MFAQLHILDLPVELLAQILLALPTIDLYTNERVCRTFRSLVRSTPVIVLARAAYEAGMIDNVHSSLPARRRHNLLDERERAWKTLDTVRHASVPVTFEEPLGEIYELKSGYFVLSGRTAIAGDRKHTINYLDMRAVVKGQPGQLPWRTLGTPAEILDVALCVEEHDLVATLSLEKHPEQRADVVLDLRQMSTGQAHPLARFHTLHISSESSLQPRPQTNLEVVGDYVGVLVSYSWVMDEEVKLADDCFSVYNWKTGSKLLQLTAPRRSYSSFVFLSYQEILFANQLDGTLELYQIPDLSKQTSDLAEASFPNPKLLRTFGLPRLSEDVQYHTISCRSVPSPVGTNSHPDGSTPFALDPDASIVVVSISFRRGPIFLPGLSFVTHRAFLLSPIHTPPPYRLHFNQNGVPVSIVPWEDWGPSATRWFADNDSTEGWITTTAGTRYVRLDGKGHLRLYDFGRARVQRALSQLMNQLDQSDEEAEAEALAAGTQLHRKRRRESDDGHAALIALLRKRKLTWMLDDRDRPSGIPVSGRLQPGETRLQIMSETIWSPVFANDARVQFELPCIETVSRTSFGFNVALMDNDRILGLHVNEEDQEVRTVEIFTISPPI